MSRIPFPPISSPNTLSQESEKPMKISRMENRWTMDHDCPTTSSMTPCSRIRAHSLAAHT